MQKEDVPITGSNRRFSGHYVYLLVVLQRKKLKQKSRLKSFVISESFLKLLEIELSTGHL